MHGLMIAGTGADSGKSCYSIGLLRGWRDLGIRVQPFKAVTVVDLHDPSCPHPGVWQRGVYHHCFAADRDWAWWHNPVTVLPSADGATGELLVKTVHIGQVRLRPGDHVLFEELPDRLFTACRQAIVEAIEVLTAGTDVVIVEGAGSFHQHHPQTDLVNRLPAVSFGLPVVLVVKGADDTTASRITACVRGSAQAAGALRGFAINGVTDPVGLPAITEQAQRMSGLDCLGWTPQVRYPDYDGSLRAQQERYRVWADALTAGTSLMSLDVAQPMGS
ncbi:MAG TPA: dethiobiotin synthase [Candidatus Limnocylindrales bacterium]|nr:dethiobiotin synthase [Candidatus Limnocylindrales bacterium]